MSTFNFTGSKVTPISSNSPGVCTCSLVTNDGSTYLEVIFDLHKVTDEKKIGIALNLPITCGDIKIHISSDETNNEDTYIKDIFIALEDSNISFQRVSTDEVTLHSKDTYTKTIKNVSSDVNLLFYVKPERNFFGTGKFKIRIETN